jgi:hypothetical protein
VFLRFHLVLAGLACSVAALGQLAPNGGITNDIDEFQIRYASNLTAVTESYVNITNTGASISPTNAGNICAQVYALDPGSNLLSCCTCVIAPGALQSIPVYADLISNSLTGEHPTSAVIKLVATNLTSSSCNAYTQAPFAQGMRAWGTSLHTLPLSFILAMTESPFEKSILSQGEYNHLTAFCAFITPHGSSSGYGGQGICASCQPGAQGASTHL